VQGRGDQEPRARFELRRAGPDDLDLIVATVRIGFESYVEFAPPGWTPPAPGPERERTAALLREAGTWVALARAGGEPVGHVGFIPARERRVGEPPGPDWRSRAPVPGLAHLWQLFVLPPWWGSGVAGTLHEAALEEMRAQGYRRARLFTPSGHERARRFYERRGWSLTEQRHDLNLGLELAEYRLELGRAGAAGLNR
jgi:GNAT superfamily N-acetyltransferase